MPTPERFDVPAYILKLRPRYEDLSSAADIPRETLYFDIGITLGRIERLEELLREHGIEFP